MGRKEFLFSYKLQSIMEKSQGSNLEQEMRQRDYRKTLLIGLLAWLVVLPFLHRLGTHFWGGTAHCGLGPPISMNNQENDPQIHTQACLMEAIAQLRVPLSK